jgi:hypothetical protein
MIRIKLAVTFSPKTKTNTVLIHPIERNLPVFFADWPIKNTAAKYEKPNK